MISSNQQGPRKTPKQLSDEWHCGLCVFHKSKMLISGRDPIYEHFCAKLPPDSLRDAGRYIGKDDLTPDFCPFLTTEDK